MSKKEIHIIIKDVDPDNSAEMHEYLRQLIKVLDDNNMPPDKASYCLSEILCALAIDSKLDKEQFLKTIDLHYEDVLKQFKETK
jgi:hypothetical protein